MGQPELPEPAHASSRPNRELADRIKEWTSFAETSEQCGGWQAVGEHTRHKKNDDQGAASSSTLPESMGELLGVVAGGVLVGSIGSWK